jgi:hypothetical protein
MKIELGLGQMLELEVEINGFNDKSTGKQIINGFINQKIPLYVKYTLTELSKYLNEQKKVIDSLRDELVKKYGTSNGDDNYFLSMFIDDTKDEAGNIINTEINPKFIEFEKEYNEFLNSKKEIEYTPIDIEALKKVETTENYPTLYLLVNNEKNDKLS